MTRDPIDTKQSSQNILNNSYDKDFNVLAYEFLGYDSSSGQLVRLAVDTNGQVKIDPTNLDSRYLKLDGSNDPLTGNLQINGSADAVQLTVKGNATQTANIVEWQNSSATVLAYVSGTGVVKSSGRKQAIAIKSGNYTLTTNDEVVVFTATAVATLPAATGTGQTFRIVCRSGILTIDGNSSETIKGELTQTLTDGDDLIITDTATGIWE